MKPDNQHIYVHGVNSSRSILRDKKNNADGYSGYFSKSYGKMPLFILKRCRIILIERGGGTGPMKFQQRAMKKQHRANSGMKIRRGILNVHKDEEYAN